MIFASRAKKTLFHAYKRIANSVNSQRRFHRGDTLILKIAEDASEASFYMARSRVRERSKVSRSDLYPADSVFVGVKQAYIP